MCPLMQTVGWVAFIYLNSFGQLLAVVRKRFGFAALPEGLRPSASSNKHGPARCR